MRVERLEHLNLHDSDFVGIHVRDEGGELEPVTDVLMNYIDRYNDGPDDHCGVSRRILRGDFSASYGSSTPPPIVGGETIDDSSLVRSVLAPFPGYAGPDLSHFQVTLHNPLSRLDIVAAQCELLPAPSPTS